MRLPLLFLIPWAAVACDCQTSYRPCRELAVSDLVFVGSVESITPAFLNRWNLGNGSSVKALNDLYADAHDHPSDSALARLKEGYARMFPDLGPDARLELEQAKTVAAVTAVFYGTLNRGIRVRFKVKTLYKHEEDDDADKSEDEDSFDVWTPFNDCGLDFQAGETYLVYANNDESSGLFSTTRCSRTRRLTDAGDDLAFLFFHDEQPKESARVEGFATTDKSYQLGLSKLRDPEAVSAPSAGLVIELASDPLTRFTETDTRGRFVFDGLAEGDYKLSAYTAGYPVKPQLLAGPRPFHLEEQGCQLQYLLVPNN